jgi:hypothetical protein
MTTGPGTAVITVMLADAAYAAQFLLAMSI